MLRCESFSGKRGDRLIFSEVSFSVEPGELLCITGPNGVGKSTLLQAIAGFPDIATTGQVFDVGGSLAGLSLEERFRRGMMLTFQEPPALPGVSFLTVAREMLTAQTGIRPDIASLYRLIREVFHRLHISEDFIERSLFDGFSGGEKKRAELALLLLARPRIALIDEIDAGLDAEGRLLAQGVFTEFLAQGVMILCVTHSVDFLEHFPKKKSFSIS